MGTSNQKREGMRGRKKGKRRKKRGRRQRWKIGEGETLEKDGKGRGKSGTNLGNLKRYLKGDQKKKKRP